MLHRLLIALPFVILATSAALAQAHSTHDLFNGKDLTGWKGRPHLSPYEEAAFTAEVAAKKQSEWNADRDLHWTVREGELINDGNGVFLTTERDYADFELTLEYRTVALADSGIYLRALPQVQIWDTREEGGKWHLGADKGSGGLWNNQRHARFPTENRDRPFGEWNHLVIRMVGERTTVDFNSARVVHHVPLENFFDRNRPAPRTGPIQLQTHGGEIRFRNVRMKELSGAEANSILMREDAEGYRSLFDGSTLEGFQGATEDYTVKDGAIQCKSGRGGTLFTKEVFDDFQVRIEFRLPAAGNNGLAIRYPGHGDPAYQGFCELQVLDNTAPQYAKLKASQYHGSAYGMVPAHRGYLRPVGEWNFQEVTVSGTTLKVELNGTTILETDVSKLKEPIDESKHPGIRLRKGHFGFAGHNDPVEFRHVSVCPQKR